MDDIFYYPQLSSILSVLLHTVTINYIRVGCCSADSTAMIVVGSHFQLNPRGSQVIKLSDPKTKDPIHLILEKSQK